MAVALLPVQNQEDLVLPVVVEDQRVVAVQPQEVP